MAMHVGAVSGGMIHADMRGLPPCAQGLSGQDEAAALGALADRAGVPEALRPRYEALSIVPPDTPLPMTMLRRLWGLPCETDAEATVNLLESKVGVVVDALTSLLMTIGDVACDHSESSPTGAARGFFTCLAAQLCM